MATDDKTRDEKLQYDINREAAKISIFHLKKLINMNILLIKKYYHLIKKERQNKLIELTPLQEKRLKNKQKRLKSKAKSKYKQLKTMENNWLYLINLLKRL